MTIKPISPQEIQKIVPEAVIEVFNRLIAENWDGHEAILLVSDVREALRIALPLTEKKQSWLDIEPIYQAAGWKVEFCKPGYEDSFPAYYTFTK